MSVRGQITLGLRSSSGRKRISIAQNASGNAIKKNIVKELNLSEDFIIRRDKNGRPGDEIRINRTATANTLKLKNGDVLYITPMEGSRLKIDEDMDQNGAEEVQSSSNGAGALTSAASSTSLSSMSSMASMTSTLALSAPPKTDEVDLVLSKKDGRIQQELTPQCQHKAGTQKCLYCAPKEPYDEEYLKSKGVKHMSFHAYLKKLSRGIDKGKFANLEDISCKIKKGCTTHKPWPASICSKCQPPAITLNRQPYRHVDNIMFENGQIVDSFVDFWRATGSQRLGFLYGKYEEFPEVPLGIKAVVVAIYEPPQEGSRDGIKLIEDVEREERVDEIAAVLGLKKVGWIFTDLMPSSTGGVKYSRHMDSHFLSAQECIMAGHFQSQMSSACQQSSTGSFGSKFCTVLVTGDKDNSVHTEGYQVSNQCMALARDKCLIPTKDAPELGYVRESSNEQYVPDVFYKEKDKYGNEVTKIARPLPVEYLLIDVPVSSPKDPVRLASECAFT